MNHPFILWSVLISLLFLVLSYTLLPTPQTSLTLPDYAATTDISSEQSPVTLVDISAQMNIHQAHRQSAETISAISESLAAGACALDFDNDGWMDIFIVGGSGHSRHYGKKIWWGESGGNRLLRNVQGRQFEDVSERSGIHKQRHWGTSCAVADLDNDLDSDIVLTGYGSNQLYENLGDGTFVERSHNSGLAAHHWSTGAALTDFNQDGLTDLYVTNLVQFTKGRRTFEHEKGYSIQPVSFSPQLYDAEENALYLNRGNFQFERVQSIANNRFGRSLSAKWHDLNDDSWPDLVVINNFATPNQIYLNNKGTGFVHDTKRPERLQQSGSRSLLIDDFLNQGVLGYFLSRERGSSSVLLLPEQQESANIQPIYTDVARHYKLADHHLNHKESWGAISLDINNDGWLDLYVANGQTVPDPDSHQLSLTQENDLYLNRSGQEFSRFSGEAQARLPSSSRGAISIDVDNDGQLELLVANNNSRFQLLKVKEGAKQNWVAFVVPPSLNSLKKIAVKSDSFTQTKAIHYKQSTFSQSDPRIHFGLGAHDTHVDLHLYHAHSSEIIIKGVEANRYYQISSDGASIVPLHYQAKITKLEALIAKANAPQARHLFTIARAKLNRSALVLAWEKMSFQDQLNTLKVLEPKQASIAELLVKLSLQSEHEPLQLQAIELIQQMEWDWSINWLVPLFTRGSSRVSCKVAQVLVRMFDEEEATLRYKYQAVSSLLWALKGSSQSVKICTLDALAASESKRATIGILDLLKSNSELTTTVQSRAIRALGLIRDSSATPFLLSQLQTSNSAEVVANTLIALKRLGYQQHKPQNTIDPKTVEQQQAVDRDIALLQQTKSPQLTLESQLKWVEWLQKSPDGLVFNSSAIHQVAHQLLQKINASNATPQLVKQAYRVLARDQQLPLSGYLAKQTAQTALLPESAAALIERDHPSKERVIALVSKQPEALWIAFYKLIKELDLTAATYLTQNLLHEQKSEQLTYLLKDKKNIASGQLRTIIQHLFEHFPMGPVTNHAHTSVNSSALVNLVSLIHEAMARSIPAIQPQTVNPNLPSSILLNYLRWFYAHPPHHKNRRQQQLSARVLTHQLFQSSEINRAEKLSLLKQASRFDKESLNALVLNNRELSPTELLAILHSVKKPQKSTHVVAAAHSVLASSKTTLEQKLGATAILSQLEPEQVEKVLETL